LSVEVEKAKDFCQMNFWGFASLFLIVIACGITMSFNWSKTVETKKVEYKNKVLLR
jgi:hypothetical protein